VTGGSDGCAKSSNTHYVPNYEETIGNYANGQNGVGDTLAAIDSILKQLQDAGIKAIISPHDGNKLPDKDGKCYNGCDVYGTTYTAAQFYSSGTAKAQYDARLQSILEYKSPNFGGKQWKDLSEVILAFDIQNEPLIAAADKAAANDPDDWLCGRAGNMKKILGNSVSTP
jgi:mannan endo-1,4-beta-mannosidase